jgi:hypothetical protein
MGSKFAIMSLPLIVEKKGLGGVFIFADPFEEGAWLWLVGIQSLDAPYWL